MFKAKKVVAKAKPVAKAAVKVAPKKTSQAKPPIKKTANSVAKSKTPAKTKPTAVKKVAPKAADKPIAKAIGKAIAKPAKKALGKSPSLSAKKAIIKSPIKKQTPAVTKTTPSKASPKADPKATMKAPAKTKAQTAAPKPVPVAVTAPTLMPVMAPGMPARAGRPSSRLAQLTVPSMAQSVASTAAKASYSQTITAPVQVAMTPIAIKKDPKLANNWKTKAADQLTDAELLSMPDAEYMNEKQMAAFRSKLVTLKQDILSNAGETTEHLREDTVVVPDPADRATIEEEHALELRTRDRERKLLKKIEQSIGRIDAGDYGYCDETGEPIGVGRLLARPTATLSLEAQQRRELKQKMFGD
jgi:DnaK suppressor protein